MTSVLYKIRVPADVECEFPQVDNKGDDAPPIKRTMTFERDFLRRTVFNPQETRWGSNTEWLFAGMEIRGAFKGCKSGDIVELSSDQWEKLKTVVKNPSAPYLYEVMSQLRPCIDAVLEPVKDSG